MAVSASFRGAARIGGLWGGVCGVICGALGCALAACSEEPVEVGAGGASAGGGGSGGGGSGGSPACTVTSVEKDCGASTAWRSFACASGACSSSDAAKGATCSEGGGEVCNGKGACVAGSCTDGVATAGETDVDCGGAKCAPCANGKACGDNGDCESGACTTGGSGGSAGDGSVCAPCTLSAQCDAAKYCKQGSCAADKKVGKACGEAAECEGDRCVDGVCCEDACDGVCVACSEPGSLGTCTSVPADTDPADECASGACDGAGACKFDLGHACKLGAECSSGTCVDGVCCDTACGDACHACNVPGSVGTCAAEGLGCAGFTVMDYDVTSDGSVVAVGEGMVGGVYQSVGKCWGPDGKNTKDLFVVTSTRPWNNYAWVSVGRTSKTFAVSVQSLTHTQEIRFYDAACNPVTNVLSADGASTQEGFDMAAADAGDVTVYTYAGANARGLKRYAASGAVTATTSLAPSGGALTEYAHVALNPSTGAGVVTTQGHYYDPIVFQRFDANLALVDPNPVVVPGTTGNHSAYYDSHWVAMNDAGQFVVAFVDGTDSAFKAAIFDANGAHVKSIVLETAKVGTFDTNRGTHTVMPTPNGDFAIPAGYGAASYGLSITIVKPDGTVGKKTVSDTLRLQKIQLDGQLNLFHETKGLTGIQKNGFSLY